MNIIEAAKAAGGTVMQPYDYGAKPDRMIMSFESLELFAKIIRNQALEDAGQVCEHVKWEGCWKQAATNRAHAIRSMKKDQT